MALESPSCNKFYYEQLQLIMVKLGFKNQNMIYEKFYAHRTKIKRKTKGVSTPRIGHVFSLDRMGPLSFRS